MADSDEEYAPRGNRRDKFARERDYPEKRGRDFGGDNKRQGFQQQRGGYDNRRVGYQRDEPMQKKPRRDWEDSYDPQPPRREGGTGGLSTPALMTFKQFLATQEDSITDEDAIAKYQDYKLEFKRQELHSFFVAHKEEEWFRLKYHPEDSGKRNEQHLANVRKRLEVFNELNEKGWVKKAKLDHDHGRYIVNLMDALVVKMEGGTDEDLAVLSENDPEEEYKEQLSPYKQNKLEKREKREEEKEANDEGIGDEEKEEGEEKQERTEPKDPAAEEGTISDSDSEKESNADKGEVRRKSDQTGSPGPEKKMMLLHKTASIFLRNLPPNVTIKEVEELCKRFPGFLRVGLADPLPERKFYRRGWVSFRRDVNIKEICWNFNNIRLRDCDMGAIVNRDLTRRVRTVNGITPHKQVAQHDLRLAARLVQIFDKKAGLYQEDVVNGETKKEELPFGVQLEFGIESKNPLLENITDYLIEEASAEEEELLGTVSGGAESEVKIALDRDEKLLEVLDRIILYLRLVHSVDYYNHGEYPHEDEMPNRCGLVHVRGPPPSPNQWGQDEENNILISQQFVIEFNSNFESRLKPMLVADDKLPDTEVDKLGKKDPPKEVEAFITANCQELAKDKWLCPLSGKKFKGPEFVRKHIAVKHNDKLDEVRTEVSYFNNYLYDPKRPTTPEQKPTSLVSVPVVPPPQQETTFQRSGYEREDFNERRQQSWGDNRGYQDRSGGGWNRDGGGWREGGNRNYGNRGYGGGGGGFQRDGYHNRSGSGPRPFQKPQWGEGRRDQREQITYKDLDAPEDIY